VLRLHDVEVLQGAVQHLEDNGARHQLGVVVVQAGAEEA
jgi:hypothetical protein